MQDNNKGSADVNMTSSTSQPGDLFTNEYSGLNSEQAAHLASTIYGIDGIASILTSERDQNFLITSVDGARTVLKSTHPSEDSGVTDFQTKAQLHLMQQDPPIAIPHLINTLADQPVYWRPIGEAHRTQAIRMITFVEGVPLHKAERQYARFAAIGTALANLDKALADFQHPQMNHVLLWDIQHLETLERLLVKITDPDKRQIAQVALSQYVTSTKPRLKNLRQQVIHNDLNHYNVMVDKVDESRVTGILDFGDMVYAPVIQDLGVACAYQISSSGNPLEYAVQCIKSYHDVNPLTLEEVSLLPDLIIARLLITVLITEWRAQEHPSNREYILRNNLLSWAGLSTLQELGRKNAANFLTELMKTWS